MDYTFSKHGLLTKICRDYFANSKASRGVSEIYQQFSTKFSLNKSDQPPQNLNSTNFCNLGFLMRKRKRTNPGSGRREIPLPVPVIQHIQSFLSGKQAARTAVVSKSWYNAWLTRPNLYFNQEMIDGSRSLNFEDFWGFVNTTMQRYEESKLNVNGFNLKLNIRSRSMAKDVYELIKRVLKLCVDGTEFKSKWSTRDIILPKEVLADKRIVRLSVSGGSVCRPIGGLGEFSGLKSIKLENLSLDDDLFCETFPCLEDLSIVGCFGYKELEISSSSLKWINIVESGSFRGNLDVPNIQKFVFSGPHFPWLSLTEVLREWEAEISVHHLHHRACTSWFRNMRGLLKKLNVSLCKVSLSIRLYVYKCHHRVGWTSFRNKPTVENLMLSLPPQFYNYQELFDLLLSVCRPKCITQDWFPNSCLEEKPNNKLIKYICKRLIQDRVEDDYVYRSSVNLHFLQEVNVEIFDDTLGDWQPLQWWTLCNGSKGPENKRKVRFLLKWEKV